MYCKKHQSSFANWVIEKEKHILNIIYRINAVIKKAHTMWSFYKGNLILYAKSHVFLFNLQAQFLNGEFMCLSHWFLCFLVFRTSASLLLLLLHHTPDYTIHFFLFFFHERNKSQKSCTDMSCTCTKPRLKREERLGRLIFADFPPFFCR
jgi:hypothetical protein